MKIDMSEFLNSSMQVWILTAFWLVTVPLFEVKHGYGKDTPKTWRAGWHDQLYRQVKAVKLSNRPDCIGNNPLVWVFSNAYAAQEFYALYAKNSMISYVPLFPSSFQMQTFLLSIK